MSRGRATVLFALLWLGLLLFQFRHLLAPGHSLYLSIIDDPGAWWSWYPWDVFSARSFRAGFFPLWNPLSGTGFPHLANFASNPFSPLKWPFYFFPHYRWLDIMVLLRAWALGLFMFLFLSRLGLRPLSAGAGAVSLGLSGYVMEYINIFNLSTEMWLPAGLYLLHGQIQDRPTFRRFLLLGLVSALALTGGNPEAAFYYLLFLVLYSLCLLFSAGKPLRISAPKLLPGLAPMVMAGLLMTAQGLPLVEYLGQGWHLHTGRLHALADFKLQHFWSLLFPWLIGPNRSSEQQLFMLPYLGVVPLGLALLGWVHLRTPAEAKSHRAAAPFYFFLGYALVFLGLIYNLPLVRWLAELPPFRQTGNFKFAMLGITLSLSAAAALGLDLAASGAIERRRLSLTLAFLGLLSFLGIALAWRDPELPPVHRAGWLPSLVLLILFAGLFLFSRSRSPADRAAGKPAFTRHIFSWGLAALLTVNLLLLYPGLKPAGAIDPKRIAAVDPLAPAYLAPLQQDPGHYRFTGHGQVLHHSLNLLYGVADFRAFEALYPRDYVQTLARITGFDLAEAVRVFFQRGWSFDLPPETLHHPMVSFLGIKYFLSSSPADPPGWQLLDQAQIRVYLNPQVFPRAFVWPNTAPSAPGARLDTHELTPAELLDYRDQTVRLKATSESPARLILTDTYFPGWQAKVNDQPAKIEKAAGLVRAVPIPAGTAVVEMRYQPWAFRLGLWASLASGGLALLLAGAAGRLDAPPFRTDNSKMRC